MPNNTKGLASVSPERRREIARLGGKAASAKGRAHRWDSKSAKDASRRGVQARKLNRIRRDIPDEIA